MNMSVERAEKLEALVNQSEAWVQNCCSPEERESRLQELNRIGRETRLMSRVSERRTSVILFGLSQAGKSYLVHAMTSSPDTGRLTIELGGNQNFSSENREFNAFLREDVQSLKIGTEWNFKEWSLRGGYAYQDAPFQNTNSMSNVETYSLGLGYRMKQSKFDISYQGSKRSEVYDFYGGYSDIAPTKLAIDKSKITATISFFF